MIHLPRFIVTIAVPAVLASTTITALAQSASPASGATATTTQMGANRVPTLAELLHARATALVEIERESAGLVQALSMLEQRKRE